MDVYFFMPKQITAVYPNRSCYSRFFLLAAAGTAATRPGSAGTTAAGAGTTGSATPARTAGAAAGTTTTGSAAGMA